jgi:hypothetical protein
MGRSRDGSREEVSDIGATAHDQDIGSNRVSQTTGAGHAAGHWHRLQTAKTIESSSTALMGPRVGKINQPKINQPCGGPMATRSGRE